MAQMASTRRYHRHHQRICPEFAEVDQANNPDIELGALPGPPIRHALDNTQMLRHLFPASMK